MLEEIMYDQANRGLLDRKQVESYVHDHFSDVLVLLKDVVDYGTHLIPRAFLESGRRLEDAIVIGVLLKQVVTMADAFHILVSVGSLQAAYLPARSAFEASLYIDYILKDESERKARHYYISNLRRQRLWALRLLQGTPERDGYMHVIGYLDLDSKPDLQTRAQQELDTINMALSQANFIDINAEFERLLNSNRPNVDPSWHDPLGPRSVRSIAEKVQRLHEYDTFYSQTSEIMHSSSYRDHISFSSGQQMALHPIRNLENFTVIVGTTVPMVLVTYRTILNHYRHEELENFSLKFVNDWRTVLNGLQSRAVTYDVAPINI